MLFFPNSLCQRLDTVKPILAARRSDTHTRRLGDDGELPAAEPLSVVSEIPIGSLVNLRGRYNHTVCREEAF